MEVGQKKLENSGGKTLIRDEKGRIVPGSASLNPQGKPKGTTSITTTIRSLLEGLSPEENKTLREMFAEKLIAKAMEGDVKAMTLLMNYIDGKPKESIELEHKGSVMNVMATIKEAAEELKKEKNVNAT